MSEARRRLAEAVLSSGGRLDEALPEATAARIARCAEQYRQAGVTNGDLVVLTGLAPDTLLVAAAACWSVGAAAWVTPREREVVEADNASFVVTPAAGERTAEVDVERCGGAGIRVPATLALVHETSGSTGEPKLARRSVDSLLAEHVGYREGLGLDAEDTVRIPVPVTHSFGSGVALAALLSGCRADLRPFTTTANVAVDLDGGHATKLAVTPALLRLLTRSRRRGDSKPQAILVGAGSVSDELDAACVARFGVPVTRGYGSSETGGILIGPRGLGLPIPSVGIVGPEPGARGELVIRTATPVLGYAHEPERESLLWRTGDVVERDASGQAWFVERGPGALRANGKFIDVGPVQAALGEVEGVTEVAFAVLPRAGDAEFEDVFALVAGPTAAREALERALRAAAPQGFLPRLRIFAELPRTDIGKLDRSTLREWIERHG
ncbi:AMP-binding protein [Streptomyces sp. NPDC051243]|uniref:AMP-binding protein n=1 Tax=Streptomyces sp. NPDC051243 TaxID=3365646 RepID=UPI0037AF1373